MAQKDDDLEALINQRMASMASAKAPQDTGDDLESAVNARMQSMASGKPVESDPSAMERFKAGFMERDIKQPSGLDRGDVAEFAGRYGLETLGSTLMTPLGPGGIAAGAAAGKATHEAIRRGIGAFSPESTEMSPAWTVPAKVAGEAALQYTGAKYMPILVKGAIKGLSKAGEFVGKKVLAPIVRGTTGVSKRAYDALISDSKTILENVGFTPDDIATMGQSLQNVISSGKEAIESLGRKTLASRTEQLKKAAQDITENANFIRTKAVEAGQALQSRIGAIKDMAGKEYKSSIDKILGRGSLKYGLDAGATYPYTIDMHKPLMGTIQSIRTKFGYDLPGRVADEAETAIFNKFQNVINNMDSASVDEVYWLQRDLRHAMDLNKGKPISAALGEMRSKVLSVFEDSVPEIAPANKAYRAAMEMSDELAGMGNADVVANQIYQSFKYGGNKRDALLKFAGVDKKSNSLVKTIIENMDEYDSALVKAKDASKLASQMEGISYTYKLGEARNVMEKLAEKDGHIKSFLNSVKDKEEVYNNLGNLLEGDNISKQIVKTMAEGGKKKDALMELARTNPEIGAKISEVQNAIFGSEFSPWFREIPQTGMGRGILFGGGALAATVPALAIGAPLFSPRLVGIGTGAVVRGAKALGGVATGKTTETIGRYAIPGIASSTEELLRKKYEEQR